MRAPRRERTMPQSVSSSRGRWLFVAGLFIAGFPLVSQLSARQAQGAGNPPPPLIHSENLDPRLKGFKWRSIGPTGQGARIDDLAVDERNPSTFYIGYAVSGLWKTTNNGVTFKHLMPTLAHSIGDIALAPSNPSVIYVGTGEPNNRQSSSFGEGVFKSTDAGETWTHVGLKDTQSIARIVVHPKDPNIAWLAA